MFKLLLIFVLMTALNAAAVTIEKPVLNIPFELSTSNIIKDKTGAFSGELKETTSYKRGDLSLVDFSGICDYIKMPTASSGAYIDVNSSMLSNREITFAMWFKMDSAKEPSTLLELVSSGSATIISISTKKSSDGLYDGIAISFPTSNGINRGFTSNTQVFRVREWEHLIVSIDAINGKVFIYKNGLLYASLDVSKGAFLADAHRLWIGRNRIGTKGIIGSIDEVKAFKTIFTKEQASLLFNNEKKYLDYVGDTISCSVKNCSLKRVISSDPIGDIFGKIVFTSKTFTYDCVNDIVERGSCQYEDKKLDFNSLKIKTNGAYIDTFAGGNLGEIAKIASAQSYVKKIMSGWKGFCVSGVDEDFSWANDPYFWSSIALSALSGSVDAAAKDAAKKAAATAASATTATTAAAAAKVGVTAAKTTAKTLVDEATKNTIKTSLTEGLKQKLVDNMAQYAICAAQAGLDLAKIATAGDTIACDPVDEICQDKDKSFDQQIYPMEKQDYEDMLIENPEYSEYINIIREEDGVIYYNIVSKELDSNLNTKEFESSMKNMKDSMKAIQQFSVAASAVYCLYSGTSNTSTAKNSLAPTGEDAAAMVIGTVAKIACGPLCGAAAQVVVKFATSYKPINTCKSADDAGAKGSRHLATKQALEMNLCRKIKSSCTIKSKTNDGCQLSGYYYCCYDTVLTKTLAEQVKAQLAIDWTHCTGITLSEFMQINYSPCKDTSGIDGTTLPYYAKQSERNSAFQKKDDCLDYTQYTQYMKDLTNGEIEIDVESLINSDNNYQECR